MFSNYKLVRTFVGKYNKLIRKLLKIEEILQILVAIGKQNFFQNYFSY